MGNYRIIALDPGGTTGWALYDVDSDNNEKWTCGQIGPHEHHDELFSHLERLHVQSFTVVCESFEFRQNAQRNNLNLMSKEYIGIVKLFGQQRNVPVVFQTAGQAKPFVTDEKLKIMGHYTPGMKHARDAYRHLILYMVSRLKRVDLIESWRNL